MISLQPALRAITRSRVYSTIDVPRHFLTSYPKSRANRALFQNVRTYCLFVGHTRSGGTLFGSLLDAHPNAIISDEVDALRFVQARFSREQIFQILLDNSIEQARLGRTKSGREGKTYSYFVPGQWHGRFETLLVIGDTKAGRSTGRIGRDETLLHRLRQTLADVEVKIIHVTRNPYDTISTMMLRSGRNFEHTLRLYLDNCETIARLRQRADTPVMLLVKHEDLIAHPIDRLRTTCQFLGLTPEPGYLEACASIIYKSPSKSRHAIPWTPQRITTVKSELIDRFDFLHDYSYDD